MSHGAADIVLAVAGMVGAGVFVFACIAILCWLMLPSSDSGGK